jgi:hypothetical protein
MEAPHDRAASGTEGSLFSSEELVVQELRSLNPDELRPLDALRILDRWKRELEDSR